MSVINFGNTLSLKQAANLIIQVPENRFCLRGPPGMGKSSILEALREQLPNHAIGYIDCGNLFDGDVGMPVVDPVKLVTNYALNSAFNLAKDSTQPVVLMYDEFFKAPQSVQNMLHPSLERVNPRLGSISLPPGSIVFITSNLSSDLVGDKGQAHTLNRLVQIEVRQPNAEEFMEFGVSSGRIHPVVIAFLKEFPQALDSYRNEGADLTFSYNPKVQQAAFVSGRSLEAITFVLNKKDNMDQESLICSLKGACGEPFARALEAYIAYQDQLPSWENITKNPKSAPIPESTGACAVMVYGAITKITKESMTPFMEYLSRMEMEWQATFVINVAKNPDKQQIAFSSSTFRDWLQNNQDLL